MRYLLFIVFLIFNVVVLHAEPLMVYGFQYDSVKVTGVLIGSPAEKAGLQAGDLLVAANGSSLSGLGFTAIQQVLGKGDRLDLLVRRSGTDKHIVMTRADYYRFGRECVSGDCENGRGRVRMLNLGSREVEGNFVNGMPNGDMKIYDKNGELQYEGPASDFRASGNGVGYAKKKDGSGSYINRKGDFYRDIMFKGTKYGEDQLFISSGSYYDNEQNRIRSGYVLIRYRGRPCNLYCKDISEDGSLNGRVEVYERAQTNPSKAPLLSIAEYKDGVREGKAREWNNEDGVVHVLYYKGGEVQTEWYNAGTIVRESDTMIIAVNVHYSTTDVVNDDPTKHISYGDFRFVKGQWRYNLYSQSSLGTTLSEMKKIYDVAPAPAVASGGSSGNAAGADNGKYNSSVVNACRNEITRLYDDGFNALDYYKRARQPGLKASEYKSWKSGYESLSERIIRDVSAAIEKYKGSVPESMISELKSIKSGLEDHPLAPAFLRD